jgi:hypothetical protein
MQASPPPGPREGPSLRPLGIAVAVLALLAIVAVASRGGAPGGGGGTRSIDTDLLIEYALLVFFVVGLTLMGFVVHSMWSVRGSKVKTTRGNWHVRVFVTMVVISLVAAFALVLRQRYFNRSDRTGTIGTTTAVTTGATTTDAGRGNRGRFDWVPVIVISTLVVAGVSTAWLLAERARRRRPKSLDDLARELSEVLDDTLDDLRAEPDPRKAVIAAYARMERSLAWFGLPRRPHEAPLEYLERVLLELRASAEAVSHLTGLFERAKFSHHEIGPGLKEEAIEAVETLRDELRGYR